MPTTRSRSDVPSDILSEAWRPEAAEPVAIHVRPELHERLVGDALLTSLSDAGVRSTASSNAPIPLVRDEEIPATPGYEIHRAPPHDPNAPG